MARHSTAATGTITMIGRTSSHVLPRTFCGEIVCDCLLGAAGAAGAAFCCSASPVCLLENRCFFTASRCHQGRNTDNDTGLCMCSMAPTKDEVQHRKQPVQLLPYLKCVFGLGRGTKHERFKRWRTYPPWFYIQSAAPLSADHGTGHRTASVRWERTSCYESITHTAR